MRILYVLVRDNGDGSNTVVATFDGTLIDKMKEAYDNDDLSYGMDAYVDGDGLNYDMWTVPDSCTTENMGFCELFEEDVFY